MDFGVSAVLSLSFHEQHSHFLMQIHRVEIAMHAACGEGDQKGLSCQQPHLSLFEVCPCIIFGSLIDSHQAKT